MRAMIVTLASLVLFGACIYIFVFWPGLQCNRSESDAAESEMDNAPWFHKYPDFYSKRNSSTLVLLHVMVRHGDRTNVRECRYPKDPYTNETYSPFGWGEMTNLGKRRMYEVGRALRYNYDEFLQHYHPDELDAVSSELRRCRESLQLLLAALYPPKQEFVWMKGGNWQPIALRSMSGKDNLLGNPRHHCANWKKYFEESMESFQEVMTNHSDYFDGMQNLTGWDRDLLSVNKLYHSIITNLEWGYTLDDRLKDFWPEPTISLNRIFWKSFVYSVQQKQAIVGMLIEKVLEDSIKKMENLSKNKLHIYGCSDYNLIALLSLLGQDMYDNPSYGAYIIMELHKTQENLYYLEFFYRSHFDSPMIQLEIPDCKTSSEENKTICLFDKFLESCMKYFLQDNVC